MDKRGAEIVKECGREHETHARSVHRFEVLDFASGQNRSRPTSRVLAATNTIANRQN
jgi:hypothetical protein